MGSWRHLAVFAAATCVALGAASKAGATQSDFYGNNFDENVLIPFAVCGPGGVDTLFAVTNPGEPPFDPNGNGQAFVHVTTYSRDSQPVCDFCVPFTPGDVYPESFCRVVVEECSNTGRQALAQGDGSSVGYITVEGSTSPLCAQNSDADVGDAFYGNIYYTDLGNNRATGLPAPTFDPTNPGPQFDSTDLSEFPLAPSHELSFRFLQALAGNSASAQTQAVIWSATSGACVIAGTNTAVPDSNCLVSTGGVGDMIICDEEERCSSTALPPRDREINIFLADDFVPGVFFTDGGYFNLQSIAQTGGPVGGFDQVQADLHVIGITDQEATVAGSPAVRAAFYAPRD